MSITDVGFGTLDFALRGTAACKRGGGGAGALLYPGSSVYLPLHLCKSIVFATIQETVLSIHGVYEPHNYVHEQNGAYTINIICQGDFTTVVRLPSEPRYRKRQQIQTRNI